MVPCMLERQTDRQTDRDRETERDRDRQQTDREETDRQTDRETERDRDTETETQTQRHRQRHRQTDRQTDRQRIKTPVLQRRVTSFPTSRHRHKLNYLSHAVTTMARAEALVAMVSAASHQRHTESPWSHVPWII